MESISKKISLLNQTTLESLADVDSATIVERFTNTGLNILGADFGFVWWKDSEKSKYRLLYKSPGIPYEPMPPRESGGNAEAKKTGTPIFIEEIIQENYEPDYDVSPYMKSYSIIPITYKGNTYGNIILCYKAEHKFPEEERQLAASLGNSAAQSITIRRLLEKEHQASLVTAQREADLKAEQTRTEFIANATHEIRTPLAIIRGNSDLALINKKTSPVLVRKIFRSINHEIDHLSNIIADLTLLTVGKSITTGLDQKTNIDLGEIVKSISKRCLGLAKRKKISIRAKIEPKVFVSGDKDYLEKLLINLIRNAVDYGKQKGKVSVELKTDNESAIIIVSDNGIGISPEDLPHIFNRFYRADKGANSGRNNTGLGLAIANWVVKAHNGSISVQSELDKGTTFTIRLPRLKQG